MEDDHLGQAFALFFTKPASMYSASRLYRQGIASPLEALCVEHSQLLRK
jgi:hypothetical protein